MVIPIVFRRWASAVPRTTARCPGTSRSAPRPWPRRTAVGPRWNGRLSPPTCITNARPATPARPRPLRWPPASSRWPSSPSTCFFQPRVSLGVGRDVNSSIFLHQVESQNTSTYKNLKKLDQKINQLTLNQIFSLDHWLFFLQKKNQKNQKSKTSCFLRMKENKKYQQKSNYYLFWIFKWSTGSV